MLAKMRVRSASLLEAGLVLLAGALAFRPLDEADIFFHLSLGRAVLRHGARTVPEPTAFPDFTDPAIAAEWGFSVLSYVLERLAGFPGLCLFGVLLAMVAAYALLRLIREYAGDRHRFVQVFLGVLIVCVVQGRVAVRPQLLLLAGLPACLVLIHRYAQAAQGLRLRLGLWLVLAVVVWAQFHGSFVLAPAIFLIQVARRPRDAERTLLRIDGVVFLLLLAAMATSAYGPDIALFITSHAAGDAPRYVAEMSATTWPMLNPAGSPFVAGYFLLLLVCIVGMVVARCMFWRELLLGALGAALLWTANRFVAEAAMLVLPLSVRASLVLAEHLQPMAAPLERRITAIVMTTTCVCLLAWTGRSIHELRWQLGHLGLAVGAFPMHASRALSSLPAGSAVFTDYPSSAPLGFLTDGRLRTYVDGRTPLYFDATDFAVEREMLREGQALRNGLVRFHVRAAVVRRDSQACVELARLWPVAMVEPLYSSFVQDEKARALTTIRPCGARYIESEACAQPARVAADIALVRGHGATDLARFLQAEATVRCGGDARAALATLDALTPTSRAYGAAFPRLRAQALMSLGRFDESAAILTELVRTSDEGAINLLQEHAAGGMPLSLVGRVLSAYVDQKGDDADLGVRAVLAEVCAHTGDLECARFNATRAAVRGRRTEALSWVLEHHPSERVRQDARRWLELLPTTPAARPAP